MPSALRRGWSSPAPEPAVSLPGADGDAPIDGPSSCCKVNRFVSVRGDADAQRVPAELAGREGGQERALAVALGGSGEDARVDPGSGTWAGVTAGRAVARVRRESVIEASVACRRRTLSRSRAIRPRDLLVTTGHAISAPMTDVADKQASDGGSSLWTTPSSAERSPLAAASVDPSVSADKLREVLGAAQVRAAAFSGKVTEKLLRKRV